MANYTIKIEGMGCQKCIVRVTGALEELHAENIAVELGIAKASFAGEEAQLKDAIEDLGFDVTEITKA